MDKKTKIVATIGPSSEKAEILLEMIKSGMNVARINFSHGTHDSNGKLIDTIRHLSEKLKIPVGVMADLQGPRIRIAVDKEVEIKAGEYVVVGDTSLPANFKFEILNPPAGEAGFKSILNDKISKFFKLDWDGIVEDINVGNEILIEDGLMKIKVVEKLQGLLLGRVINGGMIKNHKGVNIPDADLEVGALTEKDEDDLKYALHKDVDFVALSFVSSAKDINDAKEKIKKTLDRKINLPQIVSKIERKEALKNIDEIISASDIIMVARGDLGIEIEESRVVIYQKEIIAKCLKSGKPVIVATQMLNSMIENTRPTRAEVSDVSNAVIDHADAVMLSGETANGKYPLGSIKTMVEIINRTEESPFDDLGHGFLGDSKSSISAAVANSAHELAKDSGAVAIVVASVSGFTAHMIARHRPQQNILVVTNNEKTHNQLAILWGTESFILPDCQTLDELIDESKKMLVKNNILKAKDRIVIVTGRPHMAREHMSLVKVEEIK
jgi:pyruvate kinase